MTPPAAGVLARRRRRAVLLWLLVAVVVWNGIFDFVQTRGIKDYLLRTAMHELGRGPAIAFPDAMAVINREAIGLATVWALGILTAGILTVRAFSRTTDPPSRAGSDRASATQAADPPSRAAGGAATAGKLPTDD